MKGLIAPTLRAYYDYVGKNKKEYFPVFSGREVGMYGCKGMYILKESIPLHNLREIEEQCELYQIKIYYL